jgi:hypothetical protein
MTDGRRLAVLLLCKLVLWIAAGTPPTANQPTTGIPAAVAAVPLKRQADIGNGVCDHGI